MNDCPIKTGLEKAYSSKLHLDNRDGRDVVVKSVGAQERQAECFFHKEMKRSNLPAMNVVIDGEELVLDFIPNAQTLGDAETPENYFKFGQAVRAMHEIKYQNSQLINKDGDLTKIKWQDFIEYTIKFGQQKQKIRNGFSSELSEKIVTKLRSYSFDEPDEPVLLHGDLHPNNVMFANDQTILFDSSDWIISGDKFYDLALIALDASDKNLMAFIEGYSEDFTLQKQKLDFYILLRAFERHPNPFEKQIPKIVERILNSEFRT